MFPASSSQCMDDDNDDVVVSAPPVSPTPKCYKGKEVIVPDVINFEDSDIAMFDGEKVDRSFKGKAIDYSSNEFPDQKAKGAVATNFVGSSVKSSASTSDNFNYADMFLDDVMSVDEYCQLLSHFDNVGIPPGVEAPMPPIPWLFDPVKSDIKSVSGSSSDTNYQAAKSFASASHNVIVPDVINIEDSDIAMFDGEKVNRSFKGKAMDYSSNEFPDQKAKGAVATNFVGSSVKSLASTSDNFNYADMFLDDVMSVDEYCQLLSHFDSAGIPPGVEAPMPPIPLLFDPVKSDIKSVFGSSSGTNYQAAKSYASASHNVIDLAGPSSNASNSNDDYPDLYLAESIDIDEYAELLAHFDKKDIPSGIEAPIPHFLSLSDHSKSNIKAVPGSSSSLIGETNVSSPSIRLSSSWKLPQVSSSKTKQSYLQHKGSSSKIPVGLAIISKSQEQTQNNDFPAKQVSSMETDETIRKVKDFKQFDTVEDHSDHHYANKSCSTMQKNWAKRIQEEWKILEKDLPDRIFVRVYETRMDLLRAVIIGAEGTPYHDGLFFFDVSFPSGYPNVPPLVYYHAHGLRLNPNLYDCGKVCLSLLNTWSGGKQEKWIPGTSTMLQVLVSIQGLILNSEPYFNEPGWASMKGTPSGELPSKKYNEDTFILSLRTMVYMMKRPPKDFEDFVLWHFHNHAHDILSACNAYMDGAQVGSPIKGSVQGVNGSKCCSKVCKNSLAQFLPTLVKELTQIGAKDCEKYLSSATVGNKQIGSMPQAAIPTHFSQWKKPF